jgi:hypothetical protein
MAIQSNEHFNLIWKPITSVYPSPYNKNYVYIYFFLKGVRDYILCFKEVHDQEKVKNQCYRL